MQHQIEKGIPLPPRRDTSKPSIFRAMEVGDSVWMPLEQKETSGRYYYISKTTGRKFATRAELKDGTNGTRIWRTE